jgi:hypothetical protein
LRKLATLDDEHTIRAFGEDAFDGSPIPTFMAGKSAHGFRPTLDDVVRAGEIPAAFRAGHGGESGTGGRFAVDRLQTRGDHGSGEENRNGRGKKNDFSVHVQGS